MINKNRIKAKYTNFSNSKTKLYPSKLILSEELKIKSITTLNKILVELINFRLILRTAHWNVKCSSFYSLHIMFDDLQEQVDNYSDEVAEQIVALGGKTNTCISEISNSILSKESLINSDSIEYINSIVSNLVTLINICREEMLRLEDEDEVTSNYLQDLILRLQKILYFLESHIQK